MADNSIGSVAEGFAQGAHAANETADTGLKWATMKNQLEVHQLSARLQADRLQEMQRSHNIQIGKVLMPMVQDIVQEPFDGPRAAKMKAFEAASNQMGINPSDFMPYLKDNKARPHVGALISTILDPNAPADVHAAAYERVGEVIGGKSAMKLLEEGAKNSTALQSQTKRAEGYADPKLQGFANQFSTSMQNDKVLSAVVQQKSGLTKFDETMAHIKSGQLQPSVNTVKELSSDIARIATQTSQTSLGAQERNDWISYQSQLANKIQKIFNVEGGQDVGVAIKRLAEMRDAMSGALDKVTQNRELELAKSRLATAKANPYMAATIDGVLDKYGMNRDDLQKWKPVSPVKDMANFMSNIDLEDGESAPPSAGKQAAPGAILDPSLDPIIHSGKAKGWDRDKVDELLNQSGHQPLSDDQADQFGLE